MIKNDMIVRFKTSLQSMIKKDMLAREKWFQFALKNEH
jgi:hypothetical protein